MIEQATGHRIIRMELKYCERCGGLLLRRTGEAVVYCGPCEAKMRDLPTAAGRGAGTTAVSAAGRVQGGEVEQVVVAEPMRRPPQSVTVDTSRRRSA